MNTRNKKYPIKTELYASKAPLEWAVVGNDTLYTAQIPIDANGDVVTGGIEAQTRQVFSNLIHTLECAGESLDSVCSSHDLCDRPSISRVRQSALCRVFCVTLSESSSCRHRRPSPRRNAG